MLFVVLSGIFNCVSRWILQLILALEIPYFRSSFSFKLNLVQIYINKVSLQTRETAVEIVKVASHVSKRSLTKFHIKLKLIKKNSIECFYTNFSWYKS